MVVDADVNALFGVLEVAENASTSSPLQRVLTVWAEHALDTQGSFQMRVSALALAKLVASRHNAIQSLQVCLCVFQPKYPFG